MSGIKKKCQACGKLIVPVDSLTRIKPDKAYLVCKCNTIRFDAVKEGPPLRVTEDDVIDEDDEELEEKKPLAPKVRSRQRDFVIDEEVEKRMFIGAMKRGTFREPSRPFAVILAFLVLGQFGAHRYYIGDKKGGAFYSACSLVTIVFSIFTAIVGLLPLSITALALGFATIQISCIVDGFKMLAISETKWALNYGEIVDVENAIRIERENME